MRWNYGIEDPFQHGVVSNGLQPGEERRKVAGVGGEAAQFLDEPFLVGQRG